ncbi:MAG: SDR family NAD(P)-dependent oxidoreductase [Spirochaetes bacterium]|nr:SDR family NAD(P)-dependent oxidoreductase [Spirochaetota bacterium]
MKKKIDVKGKAVLITGGAQGIGRATSLLLAEKGARVLACDINAEAVRSLGDKLAGRGEAIVCDVADARAMENAVSRAVKSFGRLDIVIANAGIESVGSLMKLPPEKFERVININLLGAYRAIKPALPHIVANRGHIVAISSNSILVPYPTAAAYAATKSALDSLMRSLRAELVPTGATAGAAYFGWIGTGMMERATADPVSGGLLRAMPQIANTRPKSPEHAARVILKGIEKRSAKVFSHASVRVLYYLRGFIHLFDDIGITRKMIEILRKEWQ